MWLFHHFLYIFKVVLSFLSVYHNLKKKTKPLMLQVPENSFQGLPKGEP